MQITVSLDDRELQRKLRALGPKMNAVMVKSLNRTAFEVLEAERKEALRAFRKASPRGQQFVGGKGSFRFTAATANNLEVYIRPNENVKRRLEILEEHERGGIITAGLGIPRLAAIGKLAVPIGEAAISRRTRGRVTKPFELTTLFGDDGRGFIAGGSVILERIGTPRAQRKAAGQLFGNKALAAQHGFGKTRTRALYALIAQADLPPIFHWFEVARATALRWFPIKAREEYDKTVQRLAA